MKYKCFKYEGHTFQKNIKSFEASTGIDWSFCILIKTFWENNCATALSRKPLAHSFNHFVWLVITQSGCSKLAWENANANVYFKQMHF